MTDTKAAAIIEKLRAAADSTLPVIVSFHSFALSVREWRMRRVCSQRNRERMWG